jgi:hypothetical protein
VRPIEYKIILKPSMEYLERCGRLMLNTRGMAEFLGVAAKRMPEVICTGRIPIRCRLGIGRCYRWSVVELLKWVEAGCPRRS